jgi:hypothetical protein
MEKGFYHSSRGYWQTNSDPSETVRMEYPSGTIEVPLQPSDKHTFNGTEWVAPTQAELDAGLSTSLRSKRNQKLVNEVDPLVTNPLRWAELTDAKQAEWTQYRTDLLNLPDQSGFPNSVTWPTKPT